MRLHVIYLTGWSPENVGRLFGVFHETRISQDLLKLKDGTGRIDTEKGKFNPLLTFSFWELFILCNHILPSIFGFSSSLWILTL